MHIYNVPHRGGAVHPMAFQSFLLFLVAGVALILFKRQKKYSPLPLPPGPPALPLIGNLLDVPTNGAPGFHDLCTKYGMSIPGFPCIVWISSRPFIPGDIVYLNVAGKPMIILGSQEVALDILDKRSSNYSDRAASVMVDM